MQKKPNIVFIMSDQQRADTLGCYGQKLPVTPNLDRLAAEGTLFERAYTCQPVCGPARACLQTGLYASQTGCFRNGISLKTDNTIANYFKAAGYQTAYVGKWHLASDDDIKDSNFSITSIPEVKRGGYEFWRAADVLEFTSHGYDGYIFDENGKKLDFIGYRTDCITDYAINFIRNHDMQKPFFLFLSHIEPHHQNDMGRFEGPYGSKEKWKAYTPPVDLPEGEFEGDWKENYPDYLGCCNALDTNAGKIIDTLKDKGIYDDTIIIYTSDHGCHFRTRQGEYKRNCFESCLRVPLIIKGGGFENGRKENKIVSLINLPPTLMQMAGIPNDKMTEPAIKDITDKYAYFEVSESFVGRGIRTERYTYCVFDPKKRPWKDCYGENYEDKYLFDNKTDPSQKNNLINNPEYDKIKQELKEILFNKLKRTEKNVVI